MICKLEQGLAKLAICDLVVPLGVAVEVFSNHLARLLRESE